MLKPIDASSHDGPAYLNPQITLAGRNYLTHLREQRNAKEGDGGMTKGKGQELAEQAEAKPAPWTAIEDEYGISKGTFSRKLSFVKEKFKRKVILRDTEQAFRLAQLGFHKPSLILAGGVVEELLRLFLEHKNVKPSSNTLESYIRACEEHGFIKNAIHKLADSIRQFRNIVHLEGEKSQRYSISKATAKGAVSSIFTIANGLGK